MKNKFLIFLCALVVFVSIPVSAFAQTNSYSVSTLVNIAKDYDIIIDTSKNITVVEDDSNNKLYLLTYPSTFDISNFKVTPYYSDGKFFPYSSAGAPVNIYTFDLNNIYSGCTQNNSSSTQQSYSGIITISNTDIYTDKNKSSVFFTASQSPQIVTKGALTKAISIPILSGVLNDVISLLPVVLSVLISLLAIRKGLSFTLRLLRTA